MERATRHLTRYRACFIRYNVKQHGKNGFVTATKLGTTNKLFVAATKILLQQPNVLLIELYSLLL